MTRTGLRSATPDRASARLLYKVVRAGVTSFGLNSTCGGTGGVYRLDREDDLDWLATFLD